MKSQRFRRSLCNRRRTRRGHDLCLFLLNRVSNASRKGHQLDNRRQSLALWPWSACAVEILHQRDED